MATAQVATPIAPGPFAVVAGMGAQLMAPAPKTIAAGDPENLAGRFVLNSKSFVDLQIYLKAAQFLPSSEKDYEVEFPTKMFEEWMNKDKGGGLYSVSSIPSNDRGTADPSQKTKNTMLDISSHCYNFQIKTVDKIELFGGSPSVHHRELALIFLNSSQAPQILRNPRPTSQGYRRGKADPGTRRSYHGRCRTQEGHRQSLCGLYVSYH